MKFSDIRKTIASFQPNLGRKVDKSRFSKLFFSLSSYLLPGLLLLLIVLWVESEAIDQERHSNYIINLRRTYELDARINQNVLQARYGLLNYYDPIVKDIADLKKIQTDLKQPPTFVDSAQREELKKLLKEYITVWQKKQELIERFQSQNGLLRNSLSYFPIAITGAIKNTTPQTATRLNTLLRDILLFNLSTDEELVPRINREIEQILADRMTTANNPDLKMAIAHAQIILNSRTQVNNQVKTIVTLPTTKSGERLAQAYESSYLQALHKTNTYRLWLYLLSVVLLVSVASWIIHRLKAAGVAIRQAEEKYRSIFENSAAGIFQTTPDGRYISANPKLALMYGYESAQELSRNVTNIEQQLYVLPRRQEFIRLLEEKGEVVDFESEVYRKDGSTIWISENARKVCRKGKLLYYEGTVTDITARKKAESALQESEAELRLLFAAMTDTVVVFDADGRYLKYIHTQSLDYKPAVNRIGKTVHEVLPKEIANLFVNAIREALYMHEQQSNFLECGDRLPFSQGSISVEYSLPIRGKKTWFNASVSALSENTVLWVGRNISDRKRIEESLRQSETRFRALYESNSAAVLLLEDGVPFDCNLAAEELFGYSRQQLLTTHDHPAKLSPPFQPNGEDSFSQANQNLALVHKQGKHRFEWIHRRPDGSDFPAEVWLTAVEVGDRKVVQAVIQDMSDRKRAESALQQAASAAEVANHAKSQFLSNMSHELRTPLNVILGFTQLMTRNGSLTSIQQGYMDTINRSGEHLLTLINDVLEMSKIEAGRITLNENSFDLYGLLDWLHTMLRLKAESKGLKLIFDLSPNLPKYIRTDESKLRQVLVNLLGNAVKFTQTGSVTLRVGDGEMGRWGDGESGRVGKRAGGAVGAREAEEKYQSLIQNPKSKIQNPKSKISLTPSPPHPLSPSPHLFFEVEDTGVGIAADELESLFDPFVQTEAGRNSQEGTGLGLPISKKFVHLMGGDITVESRLGSGTIFKFDIVFSAVEADSQQTSESSQQVVGLETGQPSYRILIAEDKPENRRLMVELLTPVGFEVREAIDGQEAIALWNSWKPHLIWMDMRMPVVDGYEATKQIKNSRTQAPVVIALTGSAFEEDRIVAISTGCDDYVRKPFRAEVIFEKMAEHLGVRYLYSSPRSPNYNTKNLSLPPTSMSPDELKQALAAMPVDWVEQLHQAATKVNSKQILRLIEQMPANVPLANTLTHLVNNFCFEEIVRLTQSSG